MKKLLFRGAATALVTPFTPQGELDEEMLQRLLWYQMENGADAVVLCGTTGESAVLSMQEKQRVFQLGAAVCGGKIPVIAGVGSNDTCRTVQAAKMAEQCGVDGLLVVTPYYNKTTQRGAIQHYEKILDATPLPVILYNVPSRTGVDLSVETIRYLAKAPTAAGIKEAAGSMEKIALLRAECPQDFAVYSGNDADTLPVLALGGDGVISVTSNLLPNVVHFLCKTFWDGDHATACQNQLLLAPLNRLLFEMVNPLVVKAMMTAVGFPCGECRLPLEQLSPEQHAVLLNRGRPLLEQKFILK